MQQRLDHLHQRADEAQRSNGQRQPVSAHLKERTARETPKTAQPHH